MSHTRKQHPVHAARTAGLRYVIDDAPGYRRERRRKGFIYLNQRGLMIRKAEVLQRIKALAIPPAWEEVWICPHANGHLQATGRDARGRKQYRYHPRWREVRDESKYSHMVAFAEALPRIRRRVRAHLKFPGLQREKVLATVVKLLEKSLIRVGNEEYARQNGSFGLTTMRDRHVRVSKRRVHFQFQGKSGKRHCLQLSDARLARILRHCQDLPGQELFQYVDDAGHRRKVESGHVNAYLREISGGDFTAKDFRTWIATAMTADLLRRCPDVSSARQARRNVTHAIETVSHRLGNTPTICRKSYIHPSIVECYLAKGMRRRHSLPRKCNLPKAEARVLAIIEKHPSADPNGRQLRKQLSRSLRAMRRKRKRPAPHLAKTISL